MQDGPDPRYKQAVIALIMIKFMYLSKCKIHFQFEMWELYHRNKLEAFTRNTHPARGHGTGYPWALQGGSFLLPKTGAAAGAPGQPEPCWRSRRLRLRHSPSNPVAKPAATPWEHPRLPPLAPRPVKPHSGYLGIKAGISLLPQEQGKTLL